MRITNNMLVNNMINNISTNLGRMQKYQNQLATGKKISVPSDDPIVAARALKLRTDVSKIEQYQSNAEDAQSWMEVTESTLGSIGDVLQRTRELAVQAANGTNTQSDTQKIAEEVDQLRKQLIQLGNTTYAGRYIFSGYNTDSKLLNDDGTYAIDVITTGPNAENINFNIGVADEINVNSLGGDVFSGEGQNADSTVPTACTMIGYMDTFLQQLNNGDTSGVGDSTLGNIDNAIENILRVRADVGARQNRIELTINRLETDNINFTKLMSTNEDVDMAETIMNLQNEENVYTASLSGGAKIIQPSLVDFLR
jgi:flagellar hook-associated protein 3 FlgL